MAFKYPKRTWHSLENYSKPVPEDKKKTLKYRLDMSLVSSEIKMTAQLLKLDREITRIHVVHDEQFAKFRNKEFSDQYWLDSKLKYEYLLSERTIVQNKLFEFLAAQNTVEFLTKPKTVEQIDDTIEDDLKVEEKPKVYLECRPLFGKRKKKYMIYSQNKIADILERVNVGYITLKIASIENDAEEIENEIIMLLFDGLDFIYGLVEQNLFDEHYSKFHIGALLFLNKVSIDQKPDMEKLGVPTLYIRVNSKNLMKFYYRDQTGNVADLELQTPNLVSMSGGIL